MTISPLDVTDLLNRLSKREFANNAKNSNKNIPNGKVCSGPTPRLPNALNFNRCPMKKMRLLNVLS